ncbi:MAG: hypothetical protein LQ340_006301 [Diploschistes diacapsis]|nr:MAG: hypothetical protein LQ340_006301 [Diploschistes diacapsis]
MESFVARKKRKLQDRAGIVVTTPVMEENDTDVKLATLASIYDGIDPSILLEALIAANGSVEDAVNALSIYREEPRHKCAPAKAVGYQSSLDSFRLSDRVAGKATKPLTRKGQTVHLYTPDDVAAHTPCSIIHNFLSTEEANNLLKELLAEAPTFERQSFKVFDNVVQSPHSACFYVDSIEEKRKQLTEYLYNGSHLTDVREILPVMRAVSSRVKEAVNRSIDGRIKTHYPQARKLKFQSPEEWKPNAAFVNCYAGGAESVGYHSDQLTYLGPRAVIGSISLGVSREFRVRKAVAKDDADDIPRADAEGQIAIHLPHNSLLVMHAEMQEEWKHSIAPALAIDPHPIAGNKRINITYRYYREPFHPKYGPRKRDVSTGGTDLR